MKFLTMKSSLIGCSLLSAGLILSGITVAPAAQAAIHDASRDSDVLLDLKRQLDGAARSGDQDAVESSNALARLSSSGRAALTAFLSDPHPVNDSKSSLTEAPSDGPNSSPFVEWIHTSNQSAATGVAPYGATYNVHSWADEEFKFAGISLTKTRVWGDYVTGSGKVLKTTGNGSQVLHNYQPLTEISTWDYAPQASGGKALFRAKITVKRGPAPGLGGNWSTKESIQFFRADGPGVYAHGWM